MTTTTTLLRAIEHHADHRYERRRAIAAELAGDLGGYMWQCGDRAALSTMDLPGWPECECTACGCSEPATTTDDTGVPVCDDCAAYAIDEHGDVHCARCGNVEMVIESCGAGGQMRSYARLVPPDTPAEDHDGEWACYWETVGDGSHVVSRHATRDDAEQAVAAHDWPPPGDHTAYLCGYSVRALVGGHWVPVEE